MALRLPTVLPLGYIQVDADRSVGGKKRSTSNVLGALAAVGLVVGGFFLVKRATQ